MVADAIPDLPLEQTVGGVTMQVSSAAFKSGSFVVESKVVAAPPDMFLPEELQKLRPVGCASDPDGVPLECSSAGFGRVDPRWPFVTIDYRLELPGAPPEAGGYFREEVAFTGVAMPAKLNVEVPLNQVVQTTHGTKIILRSVKAITKQDAEGGISGQLNFTFRTEYAAGSLVAQTRTGLISATDTAGRWKSGLLSPALSSVTVHSLPLVPGTVKSLNLKMAVSEDAPALRDMRWFRDFRFKVKLPPLTDEVRAANKIPDGLERQTRAANPSVSAVAEDTWGGARNNTRWRGRIWLKDQSQPPDTNRFWFLDGVSATDAVSGEPLVAAGKRWGLLEGFQYDTILGQNSYNPAYWKTNGEALAPNERYDGVSIHLPDGKTADTIHIKAKLVAARRFYSVARITNLPALKAGEEATVNREFRSREGALLTLTTIRNLTRPDELDDDPETVEYATWNHGRQGLLELTFKYTPLEEKFDLLRLHVVRVNDNVGRELSAYQPYGQLRTRPASSWVVNVQDLPAGATSFDIQVFVAEFAATGQSTTLTFRDVPVSSLTRRTTK